MKKPRAIGVAILACTLSMAWFFGIPNLTTAGPTEGALNIERVGIGKTSDGQVDLAPYSKLAPWPNTDGRYLYSGCYALAPLVYGLRVPELRTP